MILKQLYPFLIALLAISCSTKTSDHSMLELKGTVKSLTIIRYEAVEKFGKVEKGDKISRIENGDLFDLVYENTKLNFNSEKNIIDASMFDRRGNMECRMVFKEDTIIDMVLPNGELIAKAIGDNHWYPKKMDIYDSNGKLKGRILSTYEGTKKLESKTYNQDGELLQSIKRVYTGQQCSQQTTTEITTSYGYYTHEETTSVIKEEKFEYNDKGLLFKVKAQEGEKIIETEYKYKYDDVGNWIERIEYQTSIPKYIIERTFEYN